MSSHTLIASQLQRRMIRQVSMTIVIVFAFCALFVLIVSQLRLYSDTQKGREFALVRVTDVVTNRINQPVDAVINASDSLILQSLAVNWEQTDGVIDVSGAARLFENILGNQPGYYLAMRYLDKNSVIVLETRSSSDTLLSSSPRTLVQPLDSPGYLDARQSAEPGNAFFSAQVGISGMGQTDVLFVYAPVTQPQDSTNVLGMVQLVVSVEPITNLMAAVLDDPLLEFSGREVFLVDGGSRVIASSNMDSMYLESLPAYLQESPEGGSMSGGISIMTSIIDGFDGVRTPWQVIVLDEFTLLTGFWRPSAVIALVVSIAMVLAMLFYLRQRLQQVFSPVVAVSSQMRVLAASESEDEDVFNAIQKLKRRLGTLEEDLTTQTYRYRRDLEVAARIGREMATLHDTDSLLKQTINLICDEFGYYHAQVFMADDLGLNAVLVHSRGSIGEMLLKNNFRIAIGSATMVGQTAQTGKSFVINDTDNPGQLPHRPNPLLPDTRAEMTLPLFVGGKVIGVLDIQSKVMGSFRQAELPTFRLIADQLAVAIYNAQLINQTGQRMEQIDQLNRRLTRMAWEDSETNLAPERQYHYNLLKVQPGERPGGFDHEGVLTSNINIRGETLGEINIEAMPNYEFTEGDQVIMKSVADRVAVAIDNARLFQRTQNNLEETSKLYELSRYLNEANTLEDVIQAIIISVMPEAVGGQVWVFDEYHETVGPEWVEIITDVNVIGDERKIVENELLRLDDHPFLKEIERAQVSLISDIDQDDRLDEGLHRLFKGFNAVAVVMIPLTVRGTWRGIITIEFDEVRQFNEQENRIYIALVAQAGVAVDNRLLLQQTEQEMARNVNLYAASRRINQATRMQELIDAAVATTHNPALNFSLSLVDGEDDSTGWPTRERVVARSDAGNVFEANELRPLKVPLKSPLRERRPEVLSIDEGADASTRDLPEFQLLRMEGNSFMATFPLFSENELIALFRITSRKPYELLESDNELYLALTGQMSSQIRIRQLLEGTRASLDEALRLYRATSAIIFTQNIQDVYETAVEHLAAPFIHQPHQDVSISVWLAMPMPDVNTLYLECVHFWDIEMGVIAARKGQRLDSEEYPYAQLTEQAGGIVTLGSIGGVNYQTDEILVYDSPLRKRLLSDGVDSLVIAPIRSRQRWFGVVICQSEEAYAFNDSYVRFISAIADQVGIAVESMTLYEEARTETQRAQEEAQRTLALIEVAQLTTRIDNRSSFEKALSNVFERIADKAGFDRWLLLLLDEDQQTLNKVSGNFQVDASVNALSKDQYNLTNDRGVPVVDIVSIDSTLLINQPMTYFQMAYNGAQPMPENLHHLAQLFGKHIVTTVRLGGRPVGSLLLGYGLDQKDLDERDEQLTATLAAQVAVALENRNLFQTIQNEQQRLNAILRTLPAGVIVINPATLVPMEFNEQAQALLGREIDPTQPFRVEDYNLHRTGSEMHYPVDEIPIMAALRDGEAKSCDDVVVMLPSRQIDLLMDAAPIRDTNGVITAVVIAIQDISKIRRLENSLQDNLRDTVALYDAQKELTIADDIETVLEVIMRQLSQLQPAEACIILTDEHDEVYVAKTLNQPITDADALRKVLDPRRTIRISDTSSLDRKTFNLLALLNVSSLISVPMRTSSRDVPIGWLMVGGDDRYDFSEGQESMLEQFVDVAATALDNRYLIQRQQAAVRETEALYKITASISRTGEDIEELRSAMENVLDDISPDYYGVYLESDSDEFPPEARDLLVKNAPGLDALNFRDLLVNYPIGEEGLFVDDLQQIKTPDGVQQALLRRGIRAVAAVQMRPNDRSHGVLMMAYREPHRFTQRENRYLNTLADSASVILNNFSLFVQIEGSLEETNTNYQASKALSDAAEPQDVVDVVVNYLIDDKVNQVFIALLNTRRWDDPKALVRVMASWSHIDTIDLKGVALSEEQFPAWSLLAEPREVVMINDTQNSPQLTEMERMSALSLDARSLVIVPLHVPSRDIGAVWVSSPVAYAYNERDLRTFQAFAEQASLSMEAAYLLEQTERRARQLETSSKVSQSASKILDLEVLMPQLVDLIKDSFHYDHVQIFLMDEAREYAELRASTGEAGRQLLRRKHKLGKGTSSVIGQVTVNAAPQIALDTADSNVIHKPNIFLPLTRSEMALPLMIKDEVVGALDVQSNRPNAFSEEDIAALTNLAAQISVAIDNARLYEDEQAQARRIQFLFDVTTQTAAAHSLEEALNIVTRKLEEHLHPLSIVIYLSRVYMDGRNNRFMTLEATAVCGTDRPASAFEEIYVDDDNHLIGIISKSKTPFTIDNIHEEDRYQPVNPEANAAILLPLASGNEQVGIIVIEADRRSAFDKDVNRLLVALSGSLSAVIQSLILLEELTDKTEKLQELDRLKSDFLANMSHELRTPLNSIIGFSRVMLKGIDGELTEMQEQDLTTIYNSGQHLLVLINSILDQAKIAAGKLDMKFGYFEVKPLIEAVKSITLGLVKDKNINIYTEVSPHLPSVYADEFRTRQVLLNLISNAAKFTNEGSIFIRAYPVIDTYTDRTMVQIDVEDTGIGIAEKDVPLLFEAFQQVDSSLTRTQGGTGLGLPIAKSLVEIQGGQMMVESQVNVGSVFSVTIPIEPIITEADADTLEQPEAEEDNEIAIIDTDTDPVGRPATPLTRNGLPSGFKTTTQRMRQIRRSILLIEDNKDMVDQFRRTLQLEGFEVQTADHPAYAEAMASNLRPTLIIMDVNFGDAEGWNILQRLKDRDDTFDIPVIVVTLSNEQERAYRLGAHHVIQRPFLPEDLVEAAREAEKESNTERILIIDDDPQTIRLLTQLLNANGTYRVFSAESGEEGIALVARRRPDLVILDLRMPEKDGFAVLDELRSNPETANIPVMIVTGEIDFRADERAQLNNIHVLNKSDISQRDYERFIEDIRKHLDTPREK